MKIIHTSDLHLDSPLTSRLSKIQARARKKELISTFRRIINDAKAMNADAVIIAGDLFDNDSVSVKTLDYIMGSIEEASRVAFFYLPGNHEKSRLIESGVRLPENLNIFGEDWTYFRLGDAVIAGRSLISENMFNSLCLSDTDKNVVVLHGVLAERTDNTDKIGVSDASKHPIDYLALGHYHTYSKQEINPRMTAVYCGTPEGRGFDEVGEKGYVILDIDSVGVLHRFKACASRALHIIEADITDAAGAIDVENKISAALAKTGEGDLVRIVLTGNHKPGEKTDVDSLAKRFEGSRYYIEFKDETKVSISSDDYKNDKSLKGEFIRTVMAAEELSEEQKSAIIECGIKALAGEEF